MYIARNLRAEKSKRDLKQTPHVFDLDDFFDLDFFF